MYVCEQEDRAAKIAGEMKRLRFIPPTWTPEDAQQATPPDRRVTPMVEREESEGGRAPQPQKLDKLREYLRNIDEIPVCRLRPSRHIHYADFDSECVAIFTPQSHLLGQPHLIVHLRRPTQSPLSQVKVRLG